MSDIDKSRFLRDTNSDDNNMDFVWTLNSDFTLVQLDAVPVNSRSAGTMLQFQ